MSEWIKTTLGDKQYFKIQGSGIAFFEGEKNYISTSSVDLDNILFIEDIVRYCKRPSRANMQPLKNSVWFAKMKNTLKVINPTDDIINNFIFSTGFCGIYSENVNNFYLTHFLLSDQFNHEKDLKAEGSTQEAVNNSSTSTISISFPESIKEQEKIAEILTKIDESIKKTEKIISKQERIKKGLMQDLLTKGIDENGNIRTEKIHKFKDSELGRIPEDWKIKKLENITLNKKSAIKIGPFGSSLKRDYLTLKGYKIYGQENVFSDNFNIGERRINKERFNLLKSCEVKTGDILISMMGTIGKCSIIPEGIEEGIIDSHLIRIQINDLIYNKELFVQIMKESDVVISQVKNLSVGSIMEGLSSKIIKQLLFVTPGIKEQEKISEVFKKQDEIIQKEKNQLEKLQRLKKGLMQDLLNGKVKVTNLITN